MMKSNLHYTGLVSLVVALGGFLMGIDAGVLTFGAMRGNASDGLWADRFGRKPVLSTAAMASCLFMNAWAFHSATYALTEEAARAMPEDVGARLHLCRQVHSRDQGQDPRGV